MLDVRNFRGPRDNGPGHRLPTPPDLIKRDDDSDSEDLNGDEIVDRNFEFLKEGSDSMESRGGGKSYVRHDPWSNLPNDILDRMKDRYLSDQQRRLHPEDDYDDHGRNKGKRNNSIPNPFPELDMGEIGLGDDPRDMDTKTNYNEVG